MSGEMARRGVEGIPFHGRSHGLMRKDLACLLAGLVFVVGLSGIGGGLAHGSPSSIPDGPKTEPLPALDENATLSDYLAYAALNNPGLEAAFYRWKAALEEIPQMRSLPDPKFDYGYFIREVETRVGPQKQRFGLSQTFPWFGKLQLRKDIAAEAANAERERYEAIKLRLFYSVKDAYCEYYYLARTIAVTEENVDLLRQVEGVAKTRYQTGDAGFGDVIRAQVELSKLEDRLRAQRDLRGPLSARLSATLGGSATEVLPWPKEAPENLSPASDEELLAWIRERNPELRAIDFTAAKERAAADLAGKSFWPDFTLGVEVIDTGEAMNPEVDDSGKDPVVAKLSVNLPIWFRKNRAEKREAESRYRAAVEMKNDRMNILEADLRLTLYHYRDADRRVDLYRHDLIPKARQALGVSRRSFASGTASFMDLVDAQRMLLEFELSYERAVVDRAVRLAEIEMMVGEEGPGLRTKD